jgi:hypothetical protein
VIMIIRSPVYFQDPVLNGSSDIAVSDTHVCTSSVMLPPLIVGN